MPQLHQVSQSHSGRKAIGLGVRHLLRAGNVLFPAEMQFTSTQRDSAQAVGQCNCFAKPLSRIAFRVSVRSVRAVGDKRAIEHSYLTVYALGCNDLCHIAKGEDSVNQATCVVGAFQRA